MFLTQKNLQDQLKHNLDFAQKIDIATAWATSGVVLRMLKRAAKKNAQIRAIVGTFGNATEPGALEILNKIGQLRIVGDRNPMFHPKVYIFRGTRRSVAWIGSANFTRGGFERNEEIVFETEDCNSASDWFEERWNKCEELSPNAIQDYRERRAKSPPRQDLGEMVGGPKFEDGARLSYISQAHDWLGYMKALYQCDDWYRAQSDSYYYKFRGRFSVLGKYRSWFHTVTEVKPIARRGDWTNLTQNEARKLLGTYADGDLDAGLLGSMKGAGTAKNIFLESSTENIAVRGRIRRSVATVIRAGSENFPEVAVEAIRNICKENHFGIAVATRILTLARPDRVVSLNGGSQSGLGQFYGQGELGLDKKIARNFDNYSQLLETIYQKQWYDTPRPTNPFERSLWSMRAALIDCFVYEA